MHSINAKSLKICFGAAPVNADSKKSGQALRVVLRRATYIAQGSTWVSIQTNTASYQMMLADAEYHSPHLDHHRKQVCR